MKNKQMHVRHTVAAMSPDCGYIPRGANRTITEIKKYLGKKGFQIDMYGPGTKDNTIKISTLRRGSLGMRIIEKFLKITRLRWLLFYMPFPIDEFGMFTASFYIKLLLERRKYDILWIHTDRMGCFYGRFYRLLTKTPFITTANSGGNAERFALREKPDGCAIIDIGTMNLIERHRDQLSKDVMIRFIASGVPLDIFQPSGDKFSDKEIISMAHKKVKKIESPIIMGTPALVKRKGIDKLIRAVAKMKQGTLILSGGGEEKEELIKLGDKLLGNRFLYVGRFNDKDLAKFYRTGDIFSMMSDAGSESFGAVLLEAMACGKPVVARNDETRRWLIGNAGILIDDDHPETYASALEKAAKKNWGNAPVIQASKFSWEKSAEGYEKLFLDVISKKKINRLHI